MQQLCDDAYLDQLQPSTVKKLMKLAYLVEW
jgi:hypothetical protein